MLSICTKVLSAIQSEYTNTFRNFNEKGKTFYNVVKIYFKTLSFISITEIGRLTTYVELPMRLVYGTVVTKIKDKKNISICFDSEKLACRKSIVNETDDMHLSFLK